MLGKKVITPLKKSVLTWSFLLIFFIFLLISSHFSDLGVVENAPVPESPEMVSLRVKSQDLKQNIKKDCNHGLCNFLFKDIIPRIEKGLFHTSRK